MIYCIQCTMKAYVEGRAAPTFDETLEQHMARFHPDPKATRRERDELEDKLKDVMARGPI